MREFKMRASKTGALFTEPRLKSEIMSKTLQSYLNDWYLEQKFGVRMDIQSKYTDKGLMLEDLAIESYNKLFKKNYVKNDEYFEDEYIHGTPDVIDDDDDVVVDFKCSFSLSSFPFFEKTIPNKDYNAQLQSYMRLTGKSKAKLVYVLLDTPEDIIIREAKSIMYKEQLGDDFLDMLIEEVRESHTYSQVDIKDRIKVFDIQRDDDMISKIDDKVIACREYLKNIV